MEKVHNYKLKFLPELGIIGNIGYVIFYLLKFVPPQWFVEERVKHQIRISKIEDDEKRRYESRKRMYHTEAIIMLFFVLYFLSILFNKMVNNSSLLKPIVLILITLRLIDIIQVNVNIIIFDPIKLREAKLKGFVYSFGRTIILVLYNFFEVAIIFGLYYFLISFKDLHNNLNGNLTFFDRFYFSFMTQLTIGYGDITPIGQARYLVCIQGLISFFFSLLIISKIISSIPNIGSDKNQNTTSMEESKNAD